MTACPTWCIRDHESLDAFHRGAPVTFLSTPKFRGARHEIGIYLEQYINADGTQREPSIVIDGELSDSENIAEFSLADAARVATEIGRLTQVLRAGSPDLQRSDNTMFLPA